MSRESVGETIDSLLREGRIFHPPTELVKASNIKAFMDKHGIETYDELLERSKDTEWFWSEMVKEVGIEWFEEPKKVLEWNSPYVKWFIGQNIILFMTRLISRQG